jgi:hypothetical protein
MNAISRQLLLSGIIVGLLSTLGAGCAMEPTPSTQTAHIVARSGNKISVGNAVVLRGPGCLSGPSVDISTITPPQHGKVIVESENVELSSLAAGNPRCIGTTGRGKVVYYISDSNYIGEDSFSYTISSPQAPSWGVTNVSIVVDLYP